MAVMASDGPSPHFPSLRLGLTAHSHRDVTTPNPCCAPHFIPERLMFSNPTSSEPRLSSTATISDNMLSALTPPLHRASFRSLQPLFKFLLLSLGQSLLQFVSIVSPLLNHKNPIFEPIYVFDLFLFCLEFVDRNQLQL